jgi:hypothetical protein
MAECFLALESSCSNAAARSTVSPYPWSISDFCRDLSTTSCSRQQLLLGYSALMTVDYSRALITYLHPLLGLAHHFQVACYYCWVDEIVRQKLDPTTTSCGGPGHRR